MRTKTEHSRINFLVSVIIVVGSFVVIGSLSALVAWYNEYFHPYASGLITNIAAGFFGFAAATTVAAILAAKRFKAAARPIIDFIQQLREEKKISPELARKSVTCAVAILSEGNVHRAITRQATSAKPAEAGAPCPVCTLNVELVPNDPKKRCRFCYLPDALWNLSAD